MLLFLVFIYFRGLANKIPSIQEFPLSYKGPLSNLWGPLDVYKRPLPCLDNHSAGLAIT